MEKKNGRKKERSSRGSDDSLSMAIPYKHTQTDREKKK